MGSYYKFDFAITNRFFYGFNPKLKVDKNLYKTYVKFINAITDILRTYDIRITHIGYVYIIDAVMIIMDLNRFDISLCKDIYPYIRLKYSLNNESRIEHAIRNAIDAAYCRRSENTDCSRMIMFDKKPTNKQFLCMVSRELRSKLCDEIAVSPV